ncbi:MAG: hypothetical protein ACTS10_21530 [Kiloniellales bacterium]
MKMKLSHCAFMCTIFLLPSQPLASCLDELRKFIGGVDYDFPIKSTIIEVPDFMIKTMDIEDHSYSQGRKSLMVYDWGLQHLTIEDDFFTSHDHGMTWSFVKKTDYFDIRDGMRLQSIEAAEEFQDASCQHDVQDEGESIRLIEGRRIIDENSNHTHVYRFYVSQETDFLLRRVFIHEVDDMEFIWDRAYFPAPDFVFPQPQLPEHSPDPSSGGRI